MEIPISPAPPYQETEEPNAPKPTDSEVVFDNEDFVDPDDENDEDDDSDNDVDEAQAVKRAATRATNFKVLREHLLQTLALYLLKSGPANKNAIITRLAPLATEVANKGTLSALQTQQILLQLEFLKLQRKETPDPDLEFEKKLGELIAKAIFVRSRDGSTAPAIQSREQVGSAAHKADQKAKLLDDRAITMAQLWLSEQVKLGLAIVEDKHPMTAPPSFS